jgi:hypothetical protein
MNCPSVTIRNGARANGSWPLVTTRDVAFNLDQYYGLPFTLRTGTKNLASYLSGQLIVHEGYACDGYSPVLSCPFKSDRSDPWLRLTPTPACGYAPAILHDITRQFLGVQGCPWDRKQTDEWFYNCLLAGGVSKRMAGIYHHAVAGSFGSLYIAATRKVDPDLNIAF